MEIKSHPGLEAAIEQNPDSAEPYLVYADWLQQEGDPHGENIAVHCRASDPDPELRKSAGQDWRVRQARLDHELLEVQPVTWFAGFARSVSLRLGDAFEVVPRDELPSILRHQLCRFLRDLEVFDTERREPDRACQVCETLPWKRLLHSLLLWTWGDFRCSQVPADFPALRELCLTVRSLAIDAPLPPTVETLTLPANATVYGDRRRGLPTITGLELESYPGELGEDPAGNYERLINAPFFPNVRRLTAPTSHLEALSKSRLLGQLDHLELTASDWEAATLATLLRTRRRFRCPIRFRDCPPGALEWPGSLVDAIQSEFGDQVEFAPLRRASNPLRAAR